MSDIGEDIGPDIGPDVELQTPSTGGGGGGGDVAYTYFVGLPILENVPDMYVRTTDAGSTIQEVVAYPDGQPINLTGATVTFSMYDAITGAPAVLNASATVEWAGEAL